MIISDLAVSRGRKHFLELGFSKRSVLEKKKERKKERKKNRKKMHTTKHDARHTGSIFLKHDPALIYSLDSSHTHTASHTCCRILCKPTDNSKCCFWYPRLWDFPWQSTFLTPAWLDLEVMDFLWYLLIPGWFVFLLE